MRKRITSPQFAVRLAQSLITAMSLVATVSYAQSPAASLKSGESVYQSVCMHCHAQAVDNAPKFGDKKVWAPLIEEGQAILTSHAWVGVRKMPAKGGQPDLSQEEFARAVAYMARAAGGDWSDPDADMMKKIRHEEAKRLKDIKQGKD